jgi:hypothetical protein
MVLGILLAVAFQVCATREDVKETPGVTAQADANAEDAAQLSMAENLPDAPFNPGWIGSACQADMDCGFEGGHCLTEREGYPGGYCTMTCAGSCPDKRGDLYSDTLCVDDPHQAAVAQCMARCALHLGPTGCRVGYVCTTTASHASASERLVCLPDLGTPPPETACTRALQARGLPFGRPDLADQETVLGRATKACQIDTPVFFATPIHHVDFRETGRRLAEHLLVACDMALVLDRFSRVLSQLNVVEVEHVGTYNCRGVAGSTRLSSHAQGRALDVKGFERTSGIPVRVLRDWNGGNRERRRFLRDLVSRLKREHIFNVILTPDSNQAHADHLHLEW